MAWCLTPMQELKQRIRQESECQLEAGTCPKHCWNSFTDCYTPGISTKLTSVHCLKWPRLQKSLDDVGFIISSWKKAECQYQMQENIYPIMEEKLSYNTRKRENKKRIISYSPCLIFPSSHPFWYFYTYFE